MRNPPHGNGEAHTENGPEASLEEVKAKKRRDDDDDNKSMVSGMTSMTKRSSMLHRAWS